MLPNCIGSSKVEGMVEHSLLSGTGAKEGLESLLDCVGSLGRGSAKGRLCLTDLSRCLSLNLLSRRMASPISSSRESVSSRAANVNSIMRNWIGSLSQGKEPAAGLLSP